jgi:hypothetical protein
LGSHAKGRGQSSQQGIVLKEVGKGNTPVPKQIRATVATVHSVVPKGGEQCSLKKISTLRRGKESSSFRVPEDGELATNTTAAVSADGRLATNSSKAFEMC